MPKLKTIDVSYDRIRCWIDNPETEELSIKDKFILNRLEFAYDQYKNENQKTVVNRLIKKFNISQPQAYKDVQDCMKLFNPINRTSPDFLRNWIIDDARLAMKYAREKGDTRAWNSARADLIKIYLADKAEGDLINPDDLGHNNYFVVINHGTSVEKIDLNKLNEMNPGERQENIDFLYPELSSEIDTDKLMNS